MVGAVKPIIIYGNIVHSKQTSQSTNELLSYAWAVSSLVTTNEWDFVNPVLLDNHFKKYY